MGDVLGQLGRSQEAIGAYRRALGVVARIYGKKHPLVGYFHRDIGLVHENASHYEEALREFDISVAAMTDALGPAHDDLLRVRLSRASTLAILRRNDEALAEYQLVLPLIAASSGRDGIPYALAQHSMAQVYVYQARLSDALETLNAAMSVLSTQLDPGDKRLANIRADMATVLMGLGQYDDALTSYRKAADILDLDPNAKTVDRASLGIATGGALQFLGRYEDALAEYQVALPILRTYFGDNHLRVAILNSHMGFAYVSLKRYGEALNAHDRALTILASVGGPAYLELGNELTNRANALEGLGRHDEAIESALHALIIHRASNRPNVGGLRGVYHALARNLQARNKIRAATLFAKLAVNAHQRVRSDSGTLPYALRASLARTMRDAYRFLVERQIADGAFAEAQFAGSLMKADEFNEYTGADVAPVAENRLTKSEQALSTALEQKLKVAVKSASALQEEFTKRQQGGYQATELSPRYKRLAADFDSKISALSLAASKLVERAESDRQALQSEQLALNERHAEELRMQLEKSGGEVALYQAFATDSALHLFVSTINGETVHREVKIARADLANRVYDTVAAVEGRDPDADAKLAGLYDLLVHPVADDLGKARPRVVMLNLGGFLRYVPYAALKSPRGYLIEQYALGLHTPAASTVFKSSPRTGVTGAGFGTSLSHGSFPALAGVPRELEAIFTGKDASGPLAGSPMLDASFDLSSLKSALSRKPRYVHFATHFRFLPGNENGSFLLLGSGEHLDLGALRTDPGLTFTAVDLVTLSACETARGGGSEGEEIESFGTLAQLKGASAVMATLWQIADESTATLMAHFYHGLIADSLDKATALQRAQIAMITADPSAQVAVHFERGMQAIEESSAPAQTNLDTRHPYYWSAFILMGNWM